MMTIQKEKSTYVGNAFSEIDANVSDVILKIMTTGEKIKAIDTNKNKMLESITNLSAVSEETAAATEEVSATIMSQEDVIRTAYSAVETLNNAILELQEQMNAFKI